MFSQNGKIFSIIIRITLICKSLKLHLDSQINVITIIVSTYKTRKQKFDILFVLPKLMLDNPFRIIFNALSTNFKPWQNTKFQLILYRWNFDEFFKLLKNIPSWNCISGITRRRNSYYLSLSLQTYYITVLC